ncbi:MAG: imidazole glycerol phosphate synthase subunit HisH [Phycisphaerae bacterium]|nr:imidazole glycerol phosphate synthase subunit HisH [Phycisphaerae bacterium]
MILIIDYGMGNLRSVLKAFERNNLKATVSHKISDLEKSKKIVLPGVGHFNKGKENLDNLGLSDILNHKVKNDRTPILGICLGMQLMTMFSEEGSKEGFGWVDAKTIRFKFPDNKVKIPHMGWNNIVKKKKHTILDGINNNDLFYFVHSYHVICNKSEDILSKSYYGNNFVSAFQRDNIIGTQFHPEKSHSYGLRILKNFAKI